MDASASLSHSAAISLRMARDSRSAVAFARFKQWVASATYGSPLSIDRSPIPVTLTDPKGEIIASLEASDAVSVTKRDTSQQTVLSASVTTRCGSDPAVLVHFFKTSRDRSVAAEPRQCQSQKRSANQKCTL
jgi:hypothetical protein